MIRAGCHTRPMGASEAMHDSRLRARARRNRGSAASAVVRATLATILVGALVTLGAMPASATEAPPGDPEPPRAQVTLLQAAYDFQVGSIVVPQEDVSSEVHRLVYPALDPITGDGALPLLDTPTARLTADSSYWFTVPVQTVSQAQGHAAGILVSVLGILIYDGSADSNASCPQSTANAYASGIVSGLSAYVNASDPTWEFTRPATHLDLGAAGRAVSTPDAVLHITLRRVVDVAALGASASVVLEVDLQGSLPDSGPVDQRLATVTLASTEVTCTPPVGIPGPGESTPPSAPPAAPIETPADPKPSAAAAGAAPGNAASDPATDPALAESGSDLAVAPIALAGACLAALGVWLLRVRRSS